jgi:glycosyltransferase involved in cell wall biosynthesis
MIQTHEHDREFKILRVATDLYPEILGGGALHAHELSRVQAEMGHDVTVLTSDHGEDVPDREIRDSYEVRHHQQFARPLGNSLTPGMLPAIWRLARQSDVIHAHSHLYFSTNMAAAMARITEVPLVVTNHGLHSQTAPMSIQKAYAPIARWTFNAADRILCYTATDRDRLRDRGVSTPISVIHNGIDCSTFVPSAGDGERFEILFVGRLKETKGVQELLTAFATLATDRPQLTLRFVGEGPQAELLAERAAEYGLQDRVIFNGSVPNEELPAVYAESAVFALPSKVEGFPRTILEAMACSTPVVTSDLPQLQSVVERAGETVSPDKSGSLTSALGGLLDDDLRRKQLGQIARNYVVEHHSWRDTVKQTNKVYRELVDDSNVDSSDNSTICE